MNEDFIQALDASEKFERSMKVALMERILATPQQGVQQGPNHYDAYNQSIERAQSISLDYLANGISNWPTLYNKLTISAPRAEIKTIDTILDEQLGHEATSIPKRRDILEKASEYVGRVEVDNFMFIEYDDIDFRQGNVRNMAAKINSPIGDLSVLKFLDDRQTGSNSALPNPWEVIRTKIPDKKIETLVTALSDFQEKSEETIAFFGTPFGNSSYYDHDPEIRTARFQPDAARALIDRLSAELDVGHSEEESRHSDQDLNISDHEDQSTAHSKIGSPAQYEAENDESDDSSFTSLEQQVASATSAIGKQNLISPTVHDGLPDRDYDETRKRQADEDTPENLAKKPRAEGLIEHSTYAAPDIAPSTQASQEFATRSDSPLSDDAKSAIIDHNRNDRDRQMGR